MAEAVGGLGGGLRLPLEEGARLGGRTQLTPADPARLLALAAGPAAAPHVPTGHPHAAVCPSVWDRTCLWEPDPLRGQLPASSLQRSASGATCWRRPALHRTPEQGRQVSALVPGLGSLPQAAFLTFPYSPDLSACPGSCLRRCRSRQTRSQGFRRKGNEKGSGQRPGGGQRSLGWQAGSGEKSWGLGVGWGGEPQGWSLACPPPPLDSLT